MNPKMLDVTIVMPSLNEERNVRAAVADTLRAFKDFGINGEVIVINDGSSDRTPDIVNDIMKTEPNVRLVNHASPQGIGASFWDGVAAARGDVVSMFPGDNENDPWETLRYYKILEHVDIIVPFVFNKEVRSVFRNALSFVYRFIINTTFLVNFNYTNGTVLYRKSVLDEITSRSTGFFFQTDILIRAVRRGYLFAEVPYRLGMRSTGKSKAVSFPSLIRVMKGYIKLVRDIYFAKGENTKGDFAEGTSTARRHNSAQ